jgi:hypothetical protein
MLQQDARVQANHKKKRRKVEHQIEERNFGFGDDAIEK